MNDPVAALGPCWPPAGTPRGELHDGLLYLGWLEERGVTGREQVIDTTYGGIGARPALCPPFLVLSSALEMGGLLLVPSVRK